MWDETATARVMRMASLVGRQEARPQIFVAEDDPDMCALVADTLRRDGYDVTEVPDGEEVLDWIGRQDRDDEPMDLLVSDVRMPVVTGLAILRALREAHSTVPVVLMSAFADAATRSEPERRSQRYRAQGPDADARREVAGQRSARVAPLTNAPLLAETFASSALAPSRHGRRKSWRALLREQRLVP
jgi:CheY-like chemotaxis protein